MIDESESGEAYDKVANQQLRLALKTSRPTEQRDQLSPSLEAKLVRAAMSETTTINLLAKELGLTQEVVKLHLKRLGLRLASSSSSTGKTRAYQRLKKNQRALAPKVAGV